jgi:hypothetical protein
MVATRTYDHQPTRARCRVAPGNGQADPDVGDEEGRGG